MNTTHTDLLFQTDSDIADSSRRLLKVKAAATTGSPHTLASKPLEVRVHEGEAWIAESGWQVRCLDLETRSTVRLFRGHTGPVTTTASYVLDGWTALFSGSWDKTIRVWDLTSGLLYILDAHTDFIKCLKVISGNYPVLLSSSSDKTIRVWDLRPLAFGRRPVCTQTIRDHTRPVDSIGWGVSEQGKIEVFTADSMGVLLEWSLVDGKIERVREVVSHEGAVSMMVLGEDDLWTASVDQTARCLPRDGSDMVRLLHPSSVRSVLPIPVTMTQRALVVTGADDEDMRVWDMSEPDSPILVSTVEGHCGPVTGLAAWNAKGMIISSSLDGTLRFWTMHDLLEPKQLVWEEIKEATAMTEDEERELAELMD